MADKYEGRASTRFETLRAPEKVYVNEVIYRAFASNQPPGFVEAFKHSLDEETKKYTPDWGKDGATGVERATNARALKYQAMLTTLRDELANSRDFIKTMNGKEGYADLGKADVESQRGVFLAIKEYLSKPSASADSLDKLTAVITEAGAKAQNPPRIFAGNITENKPASEMLRQFITASAAKPKLAYLDTSEIAPPTAAGVASPSGEVVRRG